MTRYLESAPFGVGYSAGLSAEELDRRWAQTFRATGRLERLWMAVVEFWKRLTGERHA